MADPAARPKASVTPLKDGGNEPPRDEESGLPPPLDWEALEERGEPPPRDWAIEHWVGMGHVTLLAGRGGIGKSIMAQQMGTALALGRDFVGKIKQPRTVLMWAGEDDHDELWRRQLAICRKFSIGMGALRGRFHVEPLAATACSLFEQVQGDMIRTSMLQSLRKQIIDLQAEIVILDNIAKLYGGSENDRHHVSMFLGALNWVAEPTGAGVILLGHVAKTKDSEWAGSTAWENAARARLWLTDKPPDRKPDQDDEDDPMADLRYLAKRKVNYTSNDLVIMQYVDGAYDMVQTPARSAMVEGIDRDRAKRILLSAWPKLRSMGYEPTESKGSPSYLPKLIIKHMLGEGFSRGDLAKATAGLMTDGILKRGQIGTYTNRSPRFGLIMVESAQV